MPEKVEGAEMECRSCGTDLVCRSKHYAASGNYPEKTVLQWQNADGSAHYSTNNGKDFTCNVPDNENLDGVAASVRGDPPSNRQTEILQAILQTTIDIRQFVEIIARDKVNDS